MDLESDEESQEEIKEEVEQEVDEEKPSSSESIFNLRRFMYIFLGLLALLIMFDRGLRKDVGRAIGGILNPVIGFNGQYPILTLMCAGAIMITISTIIRDQLMNWVDMAESQKISSKFQKKLMEAKRANKQSKVKELEKKQQEISKRQMNTFKPQIKSMALTMVFVLSIFGWIWVFVGNLPNHSYSVPWALNATLNKPLIEGCFFPLPQWIGVYMLVSLPLTQVLMSVLKMIDFKSRLEEEDEF